MFHNITTGASRLRNGAVEASNILQKGEQEEYFVYFIAKTDRQRRVGTQEADYSGEVVYVGLCAYVRVGWEGGFILLHGRFVPKQSGSRRRFDRLRFSPGDSETRLSAATI